MEKVLVIGYGNPGRLDDGLGPALAEIIEAKALEGVTVDANYQLTVEDAAAVAENDIVIFADASVDGPSPFSFYRITPKSALTFSTHSIEPEHVMHLAHDLFKSKAEGYALAIRGYDFNEFGQKLSKVAQENLQIAASFIEEALRTRNFSEVRP